jgi:DNA polymerase III subunit epsilon
VSLADLDVLAIDCQTTGATPELGELLEIGWSVVRPTGLAAESTWVRLPPGSVVSVPVRRLTGWDETCDETAVAPSEAWQRVRTAAGEAARSQEGPAPTVIHYARFEERFLRHLSAAHSANEPFPFDIVCLHALAARLHPDLPRKGLRALAGYLGHSTELLRRAGPHVEATGHVWRALIPALEQRGVTTWQGVLDLAGEKAPRPSSKRIYPMPKERRSALVDAPGVYRFLRSNGDVLYVGKAVSVRRRVNSHFAKRATERALEMLTQAHDLLVTETPTALEAALLETDEIKRLRPPYNVQLRDEGRAIWFSSRDFAAQSSLRDDKHRVGPFPSRGVVAPLHALLSLSRGIAADVVARAAATHVPVAFAPDEQMFEVAWTTFRERYFPRGMNWACLARAAARIAPRLAARKEDEEEVPDRDAIDDAGEIGWTVEAILQAMEEALVDAVRGVRRARRLDVLASSTVTFREPADERARVLVLERGEIVDRFDGSKNRPLSGRDRPSWSSRPDRYGTATYDRLRVLDTELRRILTSGGEVAVLAGAAPPIAGHRGRLLFDVTPPGQVA